MRYMMTPPNDDGDPSSPPKVLSQVLVKRTCGFCDDRHVLEEVAVHGSEDLTVEAHG